MVRETRTQLLASLVAIPERYQWARFSAPELPVRVANQAGIAQAKAATRAERVTIVGGAGRGKTTLAVCLLHTILDDGADPTADKATARQAAGARFISAYELAHARAEHGLGSGKAPNLRAALEASVLLLDDLGAEPRVHNSPLSEVVYDRHRDSRRTIVTTGFEPRDIAERYGDGICRRLFEGAVVIHL